MVNALAPFDTNRRSGDPSYINLHETHQDNLLMVLTSEILDLKKNLAQLKRKHNEEKKDADGSYSPAPRRFQGNGRGWNPNRYAHVQCHNCGEYGHIVRTCPQLYQDQGRYTPYQGGYQAQVLFAQPPLPGWMNPAAGGCAQPPPPPAKGTSGRFTIPTFHFMMKSMMNLENSEPDKDAISFKPQEPQEELVKVKASLKNISLLLLSILLWGSWRSKKLHFCYRSFLESWETWLQTSCAWDLGNYSIPGYHWTWSHEEREHLNGISWRQEVPWNKRKSNLFLFNNNWISAGDEWGNSGDIWRDLQEQGSFQLSSTCIDNVWRIRGKGVPRTWWNLHQASCSRHRSRTWFAMDHRPIL